MKSFLKKLYWLIADLWIMHNCPYCGNDTKDFHWVIRAGAGMEKIIPVRVYVCEDCYKELDKDD